MTVEIYNMLYKDFFAYYEFMRDNIEKSEDAKEYIEKLIKAGDFEKLTTMKNPFDWMIESFKMSNELILKLEAIEPSYTRTFREREKDAKPNESIKYPELFIMFKKLVKAIDQENYEEADRLKNKIFRKY